MANMIAQNHQALLERNLGLDDLLSGTFNSILEIEERALDNRLTKGLSISEIHTIAAIGLYETNPMNVVAARLGVTLATLTTAAKRLSERGMVSRTRSDRDRRQVLISLTPDGRKVYRAHRLFHEKMIAAALEGLGEDEERALASALRHIKDFFDAQREHAFEQNAKSGNNAFAKK